MKSYKYYLCKSTWYKRESKSIIRNSPTEEVYINEYVDLPSISVLIDRMQQKQFPRPKNCEYEKYKEIKEEDFNLYHCISLDVFMGLKWGEESEFFIHNPYRGRYDVILFTNSKNNLNRYKVTISVNADLESGEVKLYYSRSYNRRNIIRRDSTPIDQDMFTFLLKETITYMDDFQNYEGNFDALLKLIQDSYQGKVTPIVPQHEMDLTPLILNLNERIKQIESRLMNNDADKKGSREKMRGRMEGLKTAIHEIKGFERERDNSFNR